MADNSTVERYTLELAADPASAQGAIAQISAVNASLGGIGTTALSVTQQLAALGVEAQDIFTSTGDKINLVTVETDSAADAYRVLGLTMEEINANGFLQQLQQIQMAEAGVTDQAKAASEALQQQAASESAVGDAGGGDGGGIGLPNRRVFGSAAMLLGAQGGSGAVRDIGALVSLTSFLGPAGAILGGAALAIHTITDERAAETKSVADTVAALNMEVAARGRLEQAIGAGDPGAIDVQIAKLKADANTIVQGQIEPLQNAQDTLLDHFHTLAVQQFQGMNNLTDDQLAELRTNVPQTDQDINTLAQSFADASATFQANKASVDDLTNNSLKPLQQQIADLSSQGLEGAQAIAAINAELVHGQELRKLSTQGGASDVRAQIADLAANLVLNGNQIADTNDKIINARAANKDAEADALEVYKAGLLATREREQSDLDFLQTQGLLTATAYDAGAAIRSLAQNAADLAIQAFNAAEAQKEQRDSSYLDELAAEGKAEDGLTAARKQAADYDAEQLAKREALVKTSGDKISEIETAGATRRTEIAQNNAEALARIERQFALDSQTAIGNRDAYGLQQAEAKRAKDEADQAAALKKETDQQATAQAQQITQQKKALDSQIQQLEEATRKQDAINQQAIQQRQDDLKNIQAAETALSYNHSIGVLSNSQMMWQGLESTALTYAQRIVNAVDSTFGLPTAFQNLPVLPSYQETGGGYSPLPPVSGTAAGTRTMTLNFNSIDHAPVINAVLQVLDSVLPSDYRAA